MINTDVTILKPNVCNFAETRLNYAETTITILKNNNKMYLCCRWNANMRINGFNYVETGI
jgi:hypothetical protein